MKNWMLAGAALAALSGVAAAQTPEPTVQQQFESASSASGRKDWKEALSIFERLEARLNSGKNVRSLALVRVRKAEALMALDRREEAMAAIQAGLPHLPKADASLAEDRYLAQYQLGQLAEQALDYGGAVAAYRAAEAEATAPIQKIQALGGIIRTGMFYEGASALADADRALSLVSTAVPENKTLAAQFRNLRGRVLLNLGRYDEAHKEFQKAMKDLGGLTLKVDISDLFARGDLALSALLLKDEENARRYLAYTGAGRTRVSFPRGVNMQPPACDETGLSPADVAIVEIAIDPDGTVIGARPIYASVQGPAALAFARAALKWSWSAETAAKIEPLLRLSTRVEMRCSNAVQRPPILDILRPDIAAWLNGQGSELPEETDEAPSRLLQAQRDALAKMDAAGDGQSVKALSALIDLAENPVAAIEEKLFSVNRAITIARAESAPGAVIAYLEANRLSFEAMRNVTKRGWKPPEMTPLLSDPMIAADPRASAALKLLEADRLDKAHKAEARAILTAITDRPGLTAKDPLRVGALVRLASLEITDGNVEAARAAYAATGLSAEQCALVDAKPDLTSGLPSSDVFPMAALRWGFEGWAQTEFDVKPDGRTQNVRTVVAYPPFVFGTATEGVAKKARYSQTYRPEGGLGCSAMDYSISYRLPD